MGLRHMSLSGLVATAILGIAACPAVTPLSTCNEDSDCPAGYICARGACVRVGLDATAADGQAIDVARVDGALDANAHADLIQLDARTDASGWERPVTDGPATDLGQPDRPALDVVGLDGACLDVAAADQATQDQRAVDSDVRDSATTDGWRPDASAQDLATTDLATTSDVLAPDLGTTDVTTAADQGVQADGSLPDLFVATDTAVTADTCVSTAGQYCARTGYCGAQYNCAGQCVGGTPDPSCSQCGTRTCQNLQSWSPCEGGSCGSYSICDPASGLCVCQIDNCTGPYCCGTDVCCDVDVYGCGYDTVVEWCPDDAPCDGNSMSCTRSPACSFENCSGCCDAWGICQSGYSNQACGSSGSMCEDCSLRGDGCQIWDCTQNRECDVYSPVANGTPCGMASQCWGGVCTTCVPQTGTPCPVTCACTDGSTQFPGVVLCTGFCALPPGCSCAAACLGPC